MTESEAIKWQESFKETYKGFPKYADVACDMAISALEEVEKYRNIGVVSADELEQDLLLYKADREVLSEYHALGTVEELRIAKEKQIAKKPHKNFEKFSGVWCSCGKYLGKGYFVDKPSYCHDCGQALDWSDTD